MNGKELFTAVVEQLSSNSVPVKLGKDPQTNYDSVIYTYGGEDKYYCVDGYNFAGKLQILMRAIAPSLR